MVERILPVGAELQREGGGVHFRIWAPKAHRIAVRARGQSTWLNPEPEGYFTGLREDMRAGDFYGFLIDDDKKLYPDPSSRFQPEGPHGASEVVDPSAFAWRDRDWKGLTSETPVIYELHIGTFTPEGTWRAASEKLPLLADIGVTLIEMMPVAAFVGDRGWGYDGVCWFAPTELYGRPDDLRQFIDDAHALGIGVILDVVYNHFGPSGNYLPAFSSAYGTEKYKNEWGQALNFDGPDSGPVREFVCENACYWIREFHFDGLRLDATQQIFDDSAEYIVAELARRARAAAGGRKLLIVGENEPQDADFVRPVAKGGYGIDALWNDDFHHAVHVAMTGRNEAYYSDYEGTSRELAAALKYGFLYQGQRSSWQKKRRGSPALDLPADHRVNFLENHDQVANSGFGHRLLKLTDAGRMRAATALLVLAPGVPMLFQGQEFASSAPFLYFAHLDPELDKAVASGRTEFLSQFPSLRSVRTAIPSDRDTFERCKLDWSERERNSPILKLHRDLIALKRDDRVLRGQGKAGLETTTLSEGAFLARFLDPAGDDRLLIVNFGVDLAPRVFPQPLLSPPKDMAWALAWSSEDPAYGGQGVRMPQDDDGIWRVPGHSTILLKAEPRVHGAIS